MNPQGDNLLITEQQASIRGFILMITNRFDLSGQRVLISGARGAIGSAAARACAIMGAEVILTDIERPSELARELRADGIEASSHALDNSSRTTVEALFRDLPPLDALADCSGIYQQGDWLAGGDDWDSLLDRTLAVNLRGPVNLVRACLPRMMERGQGRIALVGSLAGKNGGSSLAVEPAYAASKGAVHTLVRYFARQAAPSGVVINAVAPGPILTPMLRAARKSLDADQYPMKRLGEPEEIGWPVAFLCSPAATFLTGVVIDINGGIAFS